MPWCYHGQWWSILLTQCPQRLQWCERFGLIILHLLHNSQYSRSRWESKDILETCRETETQYSMFMINPYVRNSKRKKFYHMRRVSSCGRYRHPEDLHRACTKGWDLHKHLINIRSMPQGYLGSLKFVSWPPGWAY